MPSYEVTFQVFGTLTTTVEAEDFEQAKEKAYDSAYVPSLCYQCSNEIELHDDVGEIIDIYKVEED